MEEVVGKRTFEDGTTQYKIKWKEFDEDHCTWEPPSHLEHAKQAGTRDVTVTSAGDVTSRSIQGA